MTLFVSSASPREEYTATAGQTAFAVPFEWRLDADLKVYVNSVLKVLGTDYTLSGAASSGGGTLTFTTPMAGGETVVVYGDMPLARVSEEYTTGGQLPGLVLEASLDDITMRMKQLQRDLERCIRLLPQDTSNIGDFALGLPASRKGKYGFFFNATTGLPELFTSIGATALSRSLIGEYLYPQTAKEVAVAVTPVAFYFPPGNSGRYANLADLVKATRDDTGYIGAGTYSISVELAILKRTILQGAGSRSGATDGTIISNITSNSRAVLIDDSATLEAQRTVLRDMSFLHHAGSHPAIRVKNGAYALFENLVINCASLGKAGIEIGDDVAATTADAWLCKLQEVRVDNAVSYCVRVNTTGHSQLLLDCALRTSVAAAHALYINSRNVQVIGGQYGANGAGGIGIYFHNIDTQAHARGLVSDVVFETIAVNQYAMVIDGTSFGFNKVHIVRPGINLSTSQGTLLKFGRTSDSVLYMPTVLAPTGGGKVCEWGEFSSDCRLVCDWDVARAAITVHASATRAVKEVVGRVPLASVANITTATNLTTILVDGIVELPGILPIHNGVSWNYVPVTPAQIVANTDNYAPTGLGHNLTFRLSTDASRNLTGIVAQAGGTRMLLCNVGAFDLVLVHDATSTAANRFLCPGSANYTLNANDSVEIEYDSTSLRWRVLEA